LILPEYSDNQLVRFLQKAFYGLKPEREGTKQIFESSRFSTDRIKAVEIASTKAAQDLDLAIDKIFPAIEKDYLVAGRKSLDQTSDAKENFLSDLYDVLRPQAPDEKLLKPKVKDQAIQDVKTVIQYKNLQREILQKTDELTRLNISTPIQNQGSEFIAQRNNIVNQIRKLKSEMDKLGEKNKGMEGLQKLSDKITDQGIFKTTDYNISPKFQKILEKLY
jgi:septal ring factor EnvC (AmiA/AmiB activator)